MYNYEAEYLKNELRSYNTIKKWLEEDSYVFAERIRFYENKIHEIDVELSSGNAKGIDYDYIPTSAVNEPLLALLAEQEECTKRYNELINLKEQDVYGFKARINYIEECLSKLDEKWQRDFIIGYYCDGEEITELLSIIPRSEAQLHRDKEILIKKMIKVESHSH